MSMFKRLGRLAVGALLATGIAAGTVAVGASSDDSSPTGTALIRMDTGWGP